MANRSFTKVTDILSGILKNSLTEDQAQAVLTAWQESKDNVSKVLTVSGKKKTDPAKPKRWLSDYLYFCKEKRPGVVKANPDLPPDEVISKLATMWKETPEDKRAKYKNLSAQDQKRYETEMASYVPSEGFEPEPKKERTGPKRPLSAYLFFCAATRSSIKAAGPKEVSVELGKRWAALTPEQRAPYEQQHEAAKAEYNALKGTTEQPAEKKATKPRKPKAAAEAAAPPAKTTKGKAAAPAAAPAAPPAKTTKGKAAPAKAAPAAVPAAAPPKTTKGKAAAPAPAKTAAPAPAKAAPKVKAKVATNTPGFAVFTGEQTEELQSEHPEWSEKQVNAEIVSRWNALSNDDRSAYELEAESQDDAAAVDV